MSQEKVDRRKYEKTHRKELIRKQRIKTALTVILSVVIICGGGGWIGYAMYTNYQERLPRSTCQVDTTAMENYLNEMYTAVSEESEDAEAAEDTDAEAAEDAGADADTE